MNNEAKRKAAAHQPGDETAGPTGGRNPAIDVMDATQDNSHSPATPDRSATSAVGKEADAGTAMPSRKPVADMTEEDLKVPDREVKKGGIPMASPLNTSGADDEHW